MNTKYYYEIQYKLDSEHNDWIRVDWIRQNNYKSYTEACYKARYLVGRAHAMTNMNIIAYRVLEYQIECEELKVFPIEKSVVA